MDRLFKHVLKSNNNGATIKIKPVLADGAYDSNESFNTLRKAKFSLELRQEGIQLFQQRMPVSEIRKSDHKKIFSDGKRKENMGDGVLLRQHFHL